MAQTKKQKAIVDRWIKELRSGAYVQGKGVLVKVGKEGEDDEFCCLGVLCDMAVRSKIIPEPLLSSNRLLHYGLNREAGDLPQEVIDWIGLKSPEGLFDYPEGKTGIYNGHTLADLNDSGKSFKAIAKIIENNKHLLFE
jgi:hypothetical protein